MSAKKSRVRFVNSAVSNFFSNRTGRRGRFKELKWFDVRSSINSSNEREKFQKFAKYNALYESVEPEKLLLQKKEELKAHYRVRQTKAEILDCLSGKKVMPLTFSLTKIIAPNLVFFREALIHHISELQQKTSKAVEYFQLIAMIDFDIIGIGLFQLLVESCFKADNIGVDTMYLCLKFGEFLLCERKIHLYQQRKDVTEVTDFDFPCDMELLDPHEEYLMTDVAKISALCMDIMFSSAATAHGDHIFRQIKSQINSKSRKSAVLMNSCAFLLILNEQHKIYFNQGAYLLDRQPMLVPPAPWTNVNDGGFLFRQSQLILTSSSIFQNEIFPKGKLEQITQIVNNISNIPWIINHDVLQIALECWERNLSFSTFRSRFIKLQPEFLEDGNEEIHRTVQQIPQAILSAKIQERVYHTWSHLSIATKFQNDTIYFPYIFDFRARMYPLATIFNHIGNDLQRGVLMFQKKKPLGERGLFWLKVQLASLFGLSKKSFEERCAFVDRNLEEIQELAESPFSNSAFWQASKKPFQLLAAIIEIGNAYKSGNPESYECSLPIQLDGTCNAYQHWSALLRDEELAKKVNLESKELQDFYSMVAGETICTLASLARGELSPKKKPRNIELYRQFVLSSIRFINRSLVKNAIMPRAYGMTSFGSVESIKDHLREILLKRNNSPKSVHRYISAVSRLISQVICAILNKNFPELDNSLNWLKAIAAVYTSNHTPVAYHTPIGFPVVQPYFIMTARTIPTSSGSLYLYGDHDNAKINISKQIQSFPPNFVHSLDSCHMLLTAEEMQLRGLNFVSVHDSYWTHPCDVDEMNQILRSTFVQMHSKCFLMELYETTKLKFPTAKVPLPPQLGNLNLYEVLKSPYFFH